MLIISSCKLRKDHIHSTKLLNFGYFTIEVPRAWKRVERWGIDSFRGEIKMGKDSTLGFDLGFYSNSLDEGSEDYFVRNDSLFVARLQSARVDRNDHTFDYKGKADSSRIAPLRINQKQWIQVDGYKAKLITPRQIGKGTTGVYIDSLWLTGNWKVGFELDGFNLNAQQQQKLIAAIKTLKFYKDGQPRQTN